ncbi:MAG: Fe(3+) ABC transporter substrate-binding protein [Betaproteobacteria bacterium RIFCSPHIGHO2_12_FULL_69_13]|nr:MAG: Fe(3+) ABC transporter substrate-binding protein [Betaproteobacteria bacterium RIFCSPHIGHO2_12_FULL_69_13]OGA67342.1 MAG: Fe(3+) ABC transporter substrate-binding protein [Betaproteobacteria bacterium RIFCSPLOWO2_12_FULL_68_20]
MKPLIATLLAVFLASAQAQDKVLNLYSSRHYQTDEALYTGFTRLTGIRINRIEAGEDALIERIRNEGARSPADVLITVDAGRLWRAEQMGLFQPVKSARLEERIPESLREPGGNWFGFSLRARVIAYNKAKVGPGEIQTYQELADPKWKGRVCMRSSTNVYNLSLMGALIDHLGEAKAEEWAKGVRANLARDPKGGDTDQLKSVAAGECDVTVSNQYYYARLARSQKPDDKRVADSIGIVFPNQNSWGTHVNISGAGVLKNAPNREAAIKFLEYLASDEAQRYFADGNNEWPVVANVKVDNPVLGALGDFKRDTLNVAVLGRNQPSSQKLYDRVAWK